MQYILLLLLTLAVIGIIIRLIPFAIILLGIYSIYYSIKHDKKLREKFKLPKGKLWGNPLLYSFIICVITFGIGTSINSTLNKSKEKIPTESKQEQKNLSVSDHAKSQYPSSFENSTGSSSSTGRKSNSSNTFDEAKVIKVVDGDTISVNLNGVQHKLRMIGVDTPETVHPNKPVEFFGKEASNFTKESLESKTVYLQKDVSDTDKYGRLFRYVWLTRPTSNKPTDDEIKDNMYNAILIKKGYGKASTYQPDSMYSKLFAKLQSDARDQYIGLWNESKSEEFKTTNLGRGGSSQNSNDTSSLNDSTSSNSSDGNISSETKFNKNYTADTTQGKIKANVKSGIYHVPGGASYNKISQKNVVYFNSEKEAQAAGYRKSQR